MNSDGRWIRGKAASGQQDRKHFGNLGRHRVLKIEDGKCINPIACGMGVAVEPCKKRVEHILNQCVMLSCLQNGTFLLQCIVR